MRMLILGTGNMAHRHAMEFASTEGCTLTAAVEIMPDRLATFCEMHSIPKGFTDLDEAIAWGEFDAAANVTPDAVHYPTTMKLIEAGVPVFCEKPLAPTYPLAAAMTQAAGEKGVVAMVNLRYRGLPVMQKARQLVEAGELGVIRHVDAAYLQSWLVGSHWGDWQTEERWLWRLSEAHGSKGVLGDVGIHILDFASFVAGQKPVSINCRMKSFLKGEVGQISGYDLDANESFVMSVGFDGGAIGTIHASRWATGYANAQKVAIFGTKGALEIEFESEAQTLRLCAVDDVHTQTWREVECPPVQGTYQSFIEAVRTGETLEPSFLRATELQHVLDLCFESDRTGATLAV
ncbi:Gfo/Idh/MocA family protein [Faunimonas pinastri]|uniref:Gfo/Idh/MocA family protein n=1 Tax=Faunimonas pinastri TaxID=1855383 RepID=UPI000B86B64F|nr:Gfo/Idh/MocA family oxidoreductase [Faunimonas pinastri]